MRILILLPLVALAACVRPSSPPPPAPVTPVPSPSPAPAPAPLASDWRDWPITPGNWTYRTDPRGSVASFGTAGSAPRLTLQCDRQAQRLILSRPDTAASSMTIRTTSLTRAVPAQPAAGASSAALTPRDPLLDAMAFSRGRFLVEAAGAPYLAIPAWAEVARVTEDCR